MTVLGIKINKVLCVLLLSIISVAVFAQNADNTINVDYSRPSKYVLGGVAVHGNTYLGKEQILQYAGLREGMEVTIPGDQVSAIVNRLWQQRYFQDVSIAVDSVSSKKDTVWLKIDIQERPRVSQWIFSGVKPSVKKEIQERTTLRRGGEYSEYVDKTTSDIIRRYFKEKAI